MMILNSLIKTNRFSFKGVIDIEINSSIDTLTDSCKIVLSRKFHWKTDKKIEIGSGAKPVFKRGDSIEINIGYGDNLVKAFDGFIVRVSADSRTELYCEDRMYLLKLNSLKKKSYSPVDLKTVLIDNLPSSINFKAVDVNLGVLRTKAETVGKLLRELRESHGLYSYFRENILYVGLAYWEEYRSIHKFKFGFNIIKDSLVFVNEEDTKIKVKVINHLDNNTVMEVIVGDLNGELRTIHLYEVQDKKSMETIAEHQITNLKYSGYNGSFTAFGDPFVRPGDAVELINTEWIEKSGTYLVNTVKYTFGRRGYRQKISIKQKIS